jgi:hypothetical protein
MKVILLFLFLISLTLFSCDEKSTIVEVEKNKLFAKIVVTTYPSYFDPDSNKIIYKETMDFQGKLIGESITSIKNILIGNENIPFEDSYSIDPKNYGVINFNKPAETFIEVFKTNKFTIYTGIGNLEGMILMPDSVNKISYNHNIQDTLKSNDSLEVSFEGNADYYVLRYWITYAIPPDTQLIYNDPGEIISKTNKFSLHSSRLNKSGILAINSIDSFNGPFLEEGSKGNMRGNGSGFLYSKISQNIYDYFFIKK